MAVADDRLIHSLATRRRSARAARVRALAAQVAAGEYRVDPALVADALVERARFHQQVRIDLLQRQESDER